MTMLSSSLRDFAERIARLDPPDAPPAAQITVDGETVTLTKAAAAALCRVLDGYADPRDHGECEACGGGRIDANFICRECGHANGVFGQLLRERSAGYAGDPAPLEQGFRDDGQLP